MMCSLDVEVHHWVWVPQGPGSQSGSKPTLTLSLTRCFLHHVDTTNILHMALYVSAAHIRGFAAICLPAVACAVASLVP